MEFGVFHECFRPGCNRSAKKGPVAWHPFCDDHTDGYDWWFCAVCGERWVPGNGTGIFDLDRDRCSLHGGEDYLHGSHEGYRKMTDNKAHPYREPGKEAPTEADRKREEARDHNAHVRCICDDLRGERDGALSSSAYQLNQVMRGQHYPGQGVGAVRDLLRGLAAHLALAMIPDLKSEE